MTAERTEPGIADYAGTFHMAGLQAALYARKRRAGVDATVFLEERLAAHVTAFEIGLELFLFRKRLTATGFHVAGAVKLQKERARDIKTEERIAISLLASIASVLGRVSSRMRAISLSSFSAPGKAPPRTCPTRY